MQCGQVNEYCGRSVLVCATNNVINSMYTDYIILFNFILHYPFKTLLYKFDVILTVHRR